MQLARTRASAPRIPWRQLGVLTLLALILAATLAVYAGSQQRLPQPFGPAANGQVVYSKGGDIFVRDSIDGASRPLIATAANESADSLSPLGTHVLIVTFEGELLSLDTATISGTDRIHLGGPFLNVNGISWSPDESSIAVAHEADGYPVITILDADGSGSRTLDLGMPANSPEFRPPDGRQLSFRGEVAGNWGLFLVNADGTGILQVPVTRDLMEAPYEVLAPTWAPDGDRIAFHRLVPTPGNGNGNGFRIHVATIDRAGGVLDQQTFTFDQSSDEEMDVRWLPDGKRIAFTRYDVDTNYVAIAEPVAGARAQDLAARSTNREIGSYRITMAPDGTFMMVHDLSRRSDQKVDIETGEATATTMNGDDLVFIQRRAP